MKTPIFVHILAASLALIASASVRADMGQRHDIRQAAPSDAYLAVYARHNQQRDYQRAYFVDAWKTFQDEQIGLRIMNIITSRLPQETLSTAETKLQELRAALEPIRFQSILNAEEIVVAEVMEGPFNQVLLAVRLNADDAADCERGVTQAFKLLASWSNNKAVVNTSSAKDVSITTLGLPTPSPLQPAIARINDIVLISTSVALLHRSVEQLQNESAKSKFDDPRLQSALRSCLSPTIHSCSLMGASCFKISMALASLFAVERTTTVRHYGLPV